MVFVSVPFSCSFMHHVACAVPKQDNVGFGRGTGGYSRDAISFARPSPLDSAETELAQGCVARLAVSYVSMDNIEMLELTALP